MNSQPEIADADIRLTIRVSKKLINGIKGESSWRLLRECFSTAHLYLDLSNPDHRIIFGKILHAEQQLRAVENAIGTIECDLSAAHSLIEKFGSPPAKS